MWHVPTAYLLFHKSLGRQNKVVFNYLENTNISRWQRTVKVSLSSCYKCCADSDKEGSDGNLEAFFTKLLNLCSLLWYLFFFPCPSEPNFPQRAQKTAFETFLKIRGNAEERSIVHSICKEKATAEIYPLHTREPVWERGKHLTWNDFRVYTLDVRTWAKHIGKSGFMNASVHHINYSFHSLSFVFISMIFHNSQAMNYLNLYLLIFQYL